jgi:hypothetical protein
MYRLKGSYESQIPMSHRSLVLGFAEPRMTKIIVNGLDGTKLETSPLLAAYPSASHAALRFGLKWRLARCARLFVWDGEKRLTAGARARWGPYDDLVGDLPGSVPDADLAPALSTSKCARLSDRLLLRGSVGGGAAVALLHYLPTTIVLAWLYEPLANHLDILIENLDRSTKDRGICGR